MEEMVLRMSNSFSVSPQTAYKIYPSSFTVKQDAPGKSSLSKAYLFPYSLWSVRTSDLCAAFRFVICFSSWSLYSWVKHICLWLSCWIMKFKAGSTNERSKQEAWRKSIHTWIFPSNCHCIQDIYEHFILHLLCYTSSRSHNCKAS